ncbi:HAMP domain-containing sensor histidine kinase [Kitasatospora sp. MAP5-34]|uniref:sensor histidine kinase n=1 Tax=Kitasatospora sp. MAP5-34 TaxID=3035102 RepID=UPI002473A78E|nr:HAMP domain-containing sensor histidine kinase [Kitasatospora sp. MAP5-34]
MSVDQARQEGSSIAYDIPKGLSPPESLMSYVVVDQRGEWFNARNLFDLYRLDTHSGWFSELPPAPANPTDTWTGLAHIARFPDGPDVPGYRSLAGRTITVWRCAVGPFTTAQLQAYTRRDGLPPQTLAVYVLIDPTDADLASAEVNLVLDGYFTPLATLFVALVAWSVTGLALRPVEAIRRRMVRIGDGAIGERVPVPPARDGIRRLAETTNTTLDKLERALQQQRRLVADASHELRSPLAALRSSLEVPLAHPHRVASWPDVVTDALTSTRRLQALAEDLLLLARAEEEHGTTETDTVDLSDLVAEQIAERTHGGGPPRFRAPELEPAVVHGREVLVGRIIRNLLDNAARYAVDEVVVRVRTEADWAVLTVHDDGPGIAPADRERVFDRFVRLDAARTRSEGGAGLGLALVRTISRSLGGTAAAIEPGPGGGACLLVRLPLHRERCS